MVFVLEIIEFKRARASRIVDQEEFLPTLRKIKRRAVQQTMAQSALPEDAAWRDEESLGAPRRQRSHRDPRRRGPFMCVIDDQDRLQQTWVS